MPFQVDFDERYSAADCEGAIGIVYDAAFKAEVGLCGPFAWDHPAFTCGDADGELGANRTEYCDRAVAAASNQDNPEGLFAVYSKL